MKKRLPVRGIIYMLVAAGAALVVVSQRESVESWVGWVGIVMIFGGGLALRYVPLQVDDGPEP